MKLLIDKEKLELRIAELEKLKKLLFKTKVDNNYFDGTEEGNNINSQYSKYKNVQVELQSILQQGEEYNENEAIEFGKYIVENIIDSKRTKLGWMYVTLNGEFTTEELYKSYKNERSHKK